MPTDFSALGTTCLTVLLQLGLVVVALVVVRKASPTAAFVLAAGAGFRLLATCCVDLGRLGLAQTYNYDLMQSLALVFRLLALLDFAVFWAAVAFAAATLGRAISATAAGGGAHG